MRPAWYTPTLKQLRQRALAWKLRMVLGAIGTLQSDDKLPHEIRKQLKDITGQLSYTAHRIRQHLGNIK